MTCQSAADPTSVVGTWYLQRFYLRGGHNKAQNKNEKMKQQSFINKMAVLVQEIILLYSVLVSKTFLFSSGTKNFKK